MIIFRSHEKRCGRHKRPEKIQEQDSAAGREQWGPGVNDVPIFEGFYYSSLQWLSAPGKYKVQQKKSTGC